MDSIAAGGFEPIAAEVSFALPVSMLMFAVAGPGDLHA
jgi:hypothetical protein